MALNDALHDRYGSPPQSEWRTIVWGDHRRTLDAGGVAVNLVDTGPEGSDRRARPVLLLHGHAGAWQNWLETIPHLARARRVLAPDLPGFGRTPLTEGELTIGRYAGVLEQLLAAADIDNVAVIGSSMGGMIAAELAARRPDLVERLVLVSPAGLSERYMGVSRRLLASYALPLRALHRAARLSRRPASFIARRPRLRRLGIGGAVHDATLIAPDIANQLIAANGRPGATPAAAALGRHDIRPALRGISMPTLIVWGDADRVVPVIAAARFRAIVPHARLAIMAGTGHLPMLERPRRFNELLDEFLAD